MTTKKGVPQQLIGLGYRLFMVSPKGNARIYSVFGKDKADAFAKVVQGHPYVYSSIGRMDKLEEYCEEVKGAMLEAALDLCDLDELREEAKGSTGGDLLSKLDKIKPNK